MRHNKLELYVHFAWSTWDRLPLITPDIEAQLHACLAQEARNKSCIPIAVGGIEDHVHVLLEIPATITIADIVKHLKGESSFAINHEMGYRDYFRWQGYYGGFTVSRWNVPLVKEYILNQRERHTRGKTHNALEFLDEFAD